MQGFGLVLYNIAYEAREFSREIKGVLIMKKTNKKVIKWMLAAGLAFGLAGIGAGNDFPGIVTAYAEEKKEVEEPKEQEIETKKYALQNM